MSTWHVYSTLSQPQITMEAAFCVETLEDAMAPTGQTGAELAIQGHL